MSITFRRIYLVVPVAHLIAFLFALFICFILTSAFIKQIFLQIELFYSNFFIGDYVGKGYVLSRQIHKYRWYPGANVSSFYLVFAKVVKH